MTADIAAIADAFAATEADVTVAVDANAAPATTPPVAPSLAKTEFREVDLTDTDALDNLIATTVRDRGRIDVWINDFCPSGEAFSALLISPERWRDNVAHKQSLFFSCAQAVGRAMVEQRAGTIVNIISADACLASAGSVMTCTVMASIAMMTRALAVEWAEAGVRVVGVTRLPLAKDTADSRIPLRRRGRAHELADAVLFLAGPDGEYIVGELLPVDGGWSTYQLF